MDENLSYAESVSQPIAPCVCGRSPNGKCNGNHLLTEEQYQFNLAQEAQAVTGQ